MTLLDHPQAQTLLNDAVLRPSDIASCADHLQTFVQRYLPCFARREQREHAQVVLQPPHGAADGAVGQMQLLRRLAEILQACSRFETTQRHERR